MVKIRLRRVGAKKKPAYRVVVADSRASRSGAIIETIGHYDPLTNPATIVIDEAKALDWLNRGAQPSETVAGLLKKLSITNKFSRSSSPVTEQKEVANNGSATKQ